MHVTVLIKHLHYYKLNIISKNQTTNLSKQQFRSNLGACKINYQMYWMKLKNNMFTCLLIS